VIQFRNFRTGQPIETDSSLFIVRHPKRSEPICIATVTRDITERKRQEAELRSKTALDRRLRLALAGAREVA
jgi:PAS domain-containing protein